MRNKHSHHHNYVNRKKQTLGLMEQYLIHYKQTINQN